MACVSMISPHTVYGTRMFVAEPASRANLRQHLFPLVPLQLISSLLLPDQWLTLGKQIGACATLAAKCMCPQARSVKTVEYLGREGGGKQYVGAPSVRRCSGIFHRCNIPVPL